MLSKFSVKKPLTVAVAVVLVVILGVLSFMNMTTDLLPSLDLPYVAVITTYPGASPEKVETSVTKPLEQALSTAGGVEKISSVSSENSSMVMVQFVQGTNMDSAMIELNSKIDLIKGNFDETVSSPMMMKINPDMLPVMVASVDVDGMDSKEVSKYVEETVIPSFERIEGVASVSANGITEDRLEIVLDQKKIDELNDKVLKSVDEGLSQAQAKLDESKSQIEAAKAQLEAGQNQGMDEIVSADSQINSGNIQIEMGSAVSGALQSQLESMTDSLKEQRDSINELIKLREELEEKLNTTKAQIEATEHSISSLQTLMDETKKQIDDIDAQIKDIDEKLSGMDEGDAQYGELLKEKESLLNRREALSDAYDTQSAQLETYKKSLESLNAMYEGLYSSLSPLDKIMHELGADSTAALKTMVETLDKTIESSESALNQLKSQNSDMQSAKDSILKAQQELEKGKLALLSKSLQASVGLSIGESQLATAQQELDKSKDEAYKAAGLDSMITAQMISGILTAENFSMPAGYIEEDGDETVVKVGNPFAEKEELENLVLFHIDSGDIGDITLKDVAEIEVRDNSDEFYAKINSNDSVILSFQKQSIFSTADVSDDINAQIKKLTEENPKLHITPLSDQGMYIDMVTGSVMENLLMGSVLAVVVLMLFLKSIKPTVTVAFSIPISLVMSVVLMYFSGVTLNIISLSGLALGVGMLVDNSIVVIENIYRLRQNGASPASAAVYGAKQVSGAIFASTLTTVCVFLPIVFTEGLSRELFSDMGLTIAYSLLSSLFVALTVVPAMSSRLLSGGMPQESKFFASFTDKYEKLLEKTLRHKAPVLIGAVALLVVSGVLASFMGTEFIPSGETTQMSVTLEMPKDTDTAERREISDTAAQRIAEIDDVDTVGAIEGSMVGAVMGGMSSGSSDSSSYSMYVVLKEDKKNTNAQIAKLIEEKTNDLNCEVEVMESGMDMSSMGGNGIQIVIKGDDLDLLQKTAGEVSDLLSDVEGIGEIDDGNAELSDEMRIVVDKNEAMRHNLTVAQIFQQLSQKLSTQTKSTTVELEGAQMPIIIVNPEESKLKKDDIESVMLTSNSQTGESTSVALGDVASLEYAQAPSSISHDEQSRTHTVSLTIADGYNIGLVSRDVEKALNGYTPPEGCSINVAGENETINESLSDLVMMVLVAIAFIYLIMVAQFQSLLSPFIVLFTIPLAFTGGLLALFITGSNISIIAMLGFLVLSGIVVNNGIVFVDYTNQLRLEGIDKRKALLMTGRARIRPILMTAMTTVFGLFTMALGIGMGADMVQPMAIVTIGGLVYATVLTLFIVPCLYDIFYRKAKMEKVELEPEENFKLI